MYELDIIYYWNFKNLPWLELHMGCIYISLNLSLPIKMYLKKRVLQVNHSVLCMGVHIKPTNLTNSNPTLQVDFYELVGGDVLEFYFRSWSRLGLDFGLIVFSTILLNLTYHIYVYLTYFPYCHFLFFIYSVFWELFWVNLKTYNII